MKGFFREYFSFSKSERNGVIVLLTIIIGLFAFKILYKPAESAPVDFSELEMLINDQKNDAVITKESKGEQVGLGAIHFEKSRKANIEYFSFNPNNLPEEKWKALGLSEKQIKVIKNYESKGGTFKLKEDVQKMYCISENMFELLAPYIAIPTENSSTQVSVNLNQADSVKLLSIKGIGPFYAGRIIELRNKLGGISHIEQLLEMWKFDERKLNAIRQQVLINLNDVKRININTCKPEELKHPYLNWNQVNAIINYRKQHGAYENLLQLMDTDVINKNTFALITPYISID